MYRPMYSSINKRRAKQTLVNYAKLLALLFLLSFLLPELFGLVNNKWSQFFGSTSVEQSTPVQARPNSVAEHPVQRFQTQPPSEPVFDLAAKRRQAQATIDGTRNMIDRELSKHP